LASFSLLKWVVPRGGLGPKSLRGNRFYKSHIDIAEKALHHFKKASIPLKIYLKDLQFLKKSSKIIEISKQKTPVLWKCLQKTSLCL
jgi:hypothetical protein